MVPQRRIARRNAPTEQRFDTDITEIIPAHKFRVSAQSSARRDLFARDIDVLTAPEVDDTNDLIDEQPRLLLATFPGEPEERNVSGNSTGAARPPGQAVTQRAKPTTHRKKPESLGAAHSRLIIAGIAAGAVAAGANATAQALPSGTASSVDVALTPRGFAPDPSGIQIVQAANRSDSSVHIEELARGAAFARERAQREAQLLRPQFVFPAKGILTSPFGTRWGALHGGLDIANAVGTPIYAANDGQVIASGPTPGYGMWVKIRGADGTITLYGHIDATTVQVGRHVTAGDQIATMGNRGNSTGPHLHFEVHLNSSEKADPMTWLRIRGVSP